MQMLNKVQLVGRVGTFRKQTFSGSQMIRFCMVTNLMFKSKDGTVVEETTWHNCTAFEGKNVSREDIEKIDKASIVSVEGRIRNIKYTTASGEDKCQPEIMVSKLTVHDNVDVFEDEKN